MTPDSYREQHLDCCGTCKYWVDCDGLINMVCGFGESLTKNSFEEAAYQREREMEKARQNWFDRGEFQSEFMRGRYASAWDICDEYTKAEAIA
jgi:hypothetical protein